MDKIALFEEIKNDFVNLQYEEKDSLDKLKRRLTMLIGKIIDSNSGYLTEFKNIRFFASPMYPGMLPSLDVDAWNRGRNQTVNLIETIIEEVRLFPKSSFRKNLTIDSSKVFIVHGHDDGAKNEVARFVEKLGLEAVILHEQVDSGDTIIEKLEKHTEVGFAIVLYTACDVGSTKNNSKNLTSRARQNVVFEHGLLIGKIGRKNVVALVKDEVEFPNDISGVIYTTMDNEGAWKYKVAREMRESNYDIDMNKVH